MITQEKTTLPIEKEGMILLSINHINTICKIKMVQKILNRNTLYGLWCKQKYHSLWLNFAHKLSPLWRSLKLTASTIKDYLNYRVGFNSSVSLYHDPQLACNSLLDLYEKFKFLCLGLLISYNLNSILINRVWWLFSICSKCSYYNCIRSFNLFTKSKFVY